MPAIILPKKCNHAKDCTMDDAVVSVRPVDWTQVDPNKRMGKVYIIVACIYHSIVLSHFL